MFKLSKKQKKIFNLVTTLLVMVTLAVLTFFVYFGPLLSSEKYLFDKLDKGYTVKSNNQEFKNTSPESVKVQRINFYKNQTVFTRQYFPQVQIIYLAQENISSIQYYGEIYQLYRTKNDFEIDKVVTFNAKNKSFDEIKQIAQKYDLSTTNPDPENITIFPPPTPEQIQLEKERKQQEQDNLNNPEIDDVTYKRLIYFMTIDLTPEAKNELDTLIQNDNFTSYPEQVEYIKQKLIQQGQTEEEVKNFIDQFTNDRYKHPSE